MAQRMVICDIPMERETPHVYFANLVNALYVSAICDEADV
jgi:hypothetical protein